MTTQDLINELKRDDQNREVKFRVIRKSSGHTGIFEIERVDIIPYPLITLIEK